MGFFTNKNLDSFDTLFVDQLQDLYDAEQRLVKALPKMASAAHNASLKTAFNQHLQETKNHVSRLEQVFRSIGRNAESKTCEAMKGLVSEGDEAVSATGNEDVKDAALIAAAQRVEHYEMAGYGTARTFAQQLGHPEAARLLQETLDEEKACDAKLNQIAESRVNRQAVHA
ncbi:MAG: ferritin-like domain-containing protein [Gemmataceae bacterium]